MYDRVRRLDTTDLAKFFNVGSGYEQLAENTVHSYTWTQIILQLMFMCVCQMAEHWSLGRTEQCESCRDGVQAWGRI